MFAACLASWAVSAGSSSSAVWLTFAALCASAAGAADNWMQDQQATHQRNEVIVGNNAALQ
jgi:hypothetical protein